MHRRFRVIRQAVAVRIRIPRIGAQFPFAAVVQAVAVRVADPLVDLSQGIRVQRRSEEAHVVDLAAPIGSRYVDVAPANPQFRLRTGMERLRNRGDLPTRHEQPRLRPVVRQRHVHPLALVRRAPVRRRHHVDRRVAVAGISGHRILVFPIAQGPSRPAVGQDEHSVRHHRWIFLRGSRILPDHRRHREGRGRHPRTGIRLDHRHVVVRPVEPERMAAAAGNPVCRRHVAQHPRPIRRDPV